MLLFPKKQFALPCTLKEYHKNRRLVSLKLKETYNRVLEISGNSTFDTEPPKPYFMKSLTRNSEPPGKYLWQELCKYPMHSSSFLPPPLACAPPPHTHTHTHTDTFQNLGLTVALPPPLHPPALRGRSGTYTVAINEVILVSIVDME